MIRPAEEERVARLLASPAFRVTPPPADGAYWQVRVRLALEQEQRRRASTLRPLRLLHIATGFGALVTAAVLLPFSPTLGVYAAPLIFTAVALGAQLLSEATPGRLR